MSFIKKYSLNIRIIFWFLVSLAYLILLIPLFFSPSKGFWWGNLYFWIYFVFALIISYRVAKFIVLADSKYREVIHKYMKNISINRALLILVVTIILTIILVPFIVSMCIPLTFKKPAIYLYPTEDTFIRIHLEVNGKIMHDNPPYNNGWEVFVSKEGIIENTYDYLFYEAQVKHIPLPKEGWMIKYSDMEEWFDASLPLLGLNHKECLQFKEYWLNELPVANYYEIKLIDKEFLNHNLKLIVNPQPYTFIRLFLFFRPCRKRTELEAPKIVPSERKGFTLVEWGGVLGR